MRDLQPRLTALATVAFYALLWTATAIFALGVRGAAADRWRGVSRGPSPVVHLHGEERWGTTVALQQYRTDDALEQALDQLAQLGVTWLRQPIRWADVEPQPGAYAWEPWDRLVRAATSRGFRLILVLDTSPAWAREEPDNPFAPPEDPHDLATFAAAVARRYGQAVDVYQIWDEPNVRPHWGDALADPSGYADLLRTVAPVIRAVDPGAVILTAGLAPNTEPGWYNMSEVRYLRGLYEAGAAPFFDVVAVKAYGFWSGPDDRRYDEAVLNWSRAVLVREVMEAAGDAATPVWFVEGGWASLPPDWAGEPPPWGSDRPEVQTARLKKAVARARAEWPWVGVMALQRFQPDAPPTDPRWGLALVGPDGAFTPLGEAWREIVRADGFAVPPPAGPSHGAWQLAVWLAVLPVAVVGGRLGWLVWRFTRAGWLAAYRRWPEWAQVAAFAVTLLLFHLAPGHPAVSVLLYLAVVWFAWARPDLGLAAVLATLPFFLWTKPFGRWRFSLPELLTVALAARYALHLLAPLARAGRFSGASARGRDLVATLLLDRTDAVESRTDHKGKREGWGDTPNAPRQRVEPPAPPEHDHVSPTLEAKTWWRRLDALDWSVLALLGLAGLSVFWAPLFGVAAREFRVVVLEPVLFYWLVRRGGLGRRQMGYLAGGLVLGGVLVSLHALWQWGAGDVVLAEGVRRVRGPYGSPNNLALYLGRVVPFTLALALTDWGDLGPAVRRRLALVPWFALALTSLALFLTFSRGAWLLGVPAALLYIALLQGPRARRVVGVMVGLGILLLVPFAQTERVRTLFDLSTGTGYMRRLLWLASLNMLRDFWLLGVGLDNFLYVYPRYRFKAAWREPDLSHPHNIVLHFWLALGVGGVLVLFWHLGAFWRTAWRLRARLRRPFERALLVGVTAMMVDTLAHGLIDNSFFLVDLAFLWMFAAAAVGWLADTHTGRENHVAAPPANPTGQ